VARFENHSSSSGGRQTFGVLTFGEKSGGEVIRLGRKKLVA